MCHAGLQQAGLRFHQKLHSTEFVHDPICWIENSALQCKVNGCIVFDFLGLEVSLLMVNPLSVTILPNKTNVTGMLTAL